MLDAVSNMNIVFLLTRSEVIMHNLTEDEHRLVAPGKSRYRNILIQREQGTGIKLIVKHLLLVCLFIERHNIDVEVKRFKNAK
jgi:hypothetical protein